MTRRADNVFSVVLVVVVFVAMLVTLAAVYGIEP